MKREKKKKRIRQHKLLNKPILGTILLVLWGAVVLTSFGSGFDMVAKEHSADYLGGGWLAAFGLLGLLIHKFHFRGEFSGNIQAKNFGMGMLLILPTMIFVVTNLLEADMSALTPGRVLLALAAGMGPGIMEEVTFRGLALSNLMRVWHDEKKIIYSVSFTAALFGLIHLGNILAGAGVLVSAVQSVYAFGTGVLFAAVYVRTGNLLPCMVAHTLVDFTAFLSPELAEAGGVMADKGFEPQMLFLAAVGLAFAALGYYYLRPAKRAEILEIWSEKWKRPAEEQLPADSGITEKELPAEET